MAGAAPDRGVHVAVVRPAGIAFSTEVHPYLAAIAPPDRIIQAETLLLRRRALIQAQRDLSFYWPDFPCVEVATVAQTPARFSVRCPRCSAAVEVTPDQVGQPVTCSDCLDDFVVEAPRDTQQHDGASPAERAGPLRHTDAAPREATGSDALLDVDWLSEEPIGAAESSRADKHHLGPTEPYEFTAVCPLCGTRQDTVSEKIGKELRCPDCHSAFIVREPARTVRRPKVSEPVVADDELRLSEPLAPKPYSRLAEDLLGAAQKEVVAPHPRSPARPAAPGEPARLTPTKAIHDTLRQAAIDVKQEHAQDVPSLPARPFRTGVMRFLNSGQAVVRLLILAFAFQLEVGAIEASIVAAEGSGTQQVIALLYRIFATVFGVLLLCFLSTSLLVLLQHTADGRDVVEEWPGANVFDWMFEAWPIIATLFLTLAPGFAVAQFTYQATRELHGFWWIGLGSGAVLGTTLFPVLLLSFMENSAPYSRPIWRSLIVAKNHWVTFWLYSGLIVLGFGVLAGVRLKFSSTGLNFGVSAALMLLLFIYFRLLGRLSWACDDALAKEEASLEEQD